MKHSLIAMVEIHIKETKSSALFLSSYTLTSIKMIYPQEILTPVLIEDSSCIDLIWKMSSLNKKLTRECKVKLEIIIHKCIILHAQISLSLT